MKCFYQANQWCAQGIEILAQPMEKCSNPEQAEEALTQLEAFKSAGVKWGASDSAELKTTFQDVITPETKALVQQVSLIFAGNLFLKFISIFFILQVITRVEDVLMMCDKRQESLKKLAVKPAPKLVQQVNPEPAIPLTRPLSCSDGQKSSSKGNAKKTNVCFFAKSLE